jgi:hypothetical protein
LSITKPVQHTKFAMSELKGAFVLKRAAVLIGVRRTGGGLPNLQAVGAGIEMMANWANSQRSCGMQDVVVLSDANDEYGKAVDTGKRQSVRAYEVTEAITKFVDSGLQQLVVYFAGHGANVRYNELWLLSGAPKAASEAVNLKGSIEIAKQCGVAHIVFIADACRTVAATLQAQAVEGSLVFPSNPSARRPGKVDVFYAAVVGRPALEVQDVAAAQRKFVAVYTKSLVEGLNGKATLETVTNGDKQVQVVRPWPLQRYLEQAVPDELERLEVPIGLEQAPDAEIMSPPESWISQPNVELMQADDKVNELANASIQNRRGGPGPPIEIVRDGIHSSRDHRVGDDALHSSRSSGARRFSQYGPVPLSPQNRRASLRSQAQSAITDALYANSQRGIRSGPSTAIASTPIDVYTARAGHELRKPGSLPCGFVIHGMEVTEVVTTRAATAQREGNRIHFSALRGPAANVLIVLENGCGTLLPVFQNFVAIVSFDEGELADVSYELMDGSKFGEDVEQSLAAMSALRHTASAAARMGVLSPDVEHRDNLSVIASRLAAVYWLDISLDLYVAYAFASLGEYEPVKTIQRALLSALEVELFDAALLLRMPGCKSQVMPNNVYPAVPLLTRGWALLGALGVVLPPSLSDVANHVTNSPWTLFDQAGVEKLRKSIANKEIL